MSQDPAFFVDGDPEAAWKVWYEDRFDREMPRQVQASGHGLATGLAQLWLYNLHEGVDADGRPTFSRFNLWWAQAQMSIEIPEDADALARLRAWVLGGNRSGRVAALDAGDRDLLQQIASVHSRLLTHGAPGKEAVRAILRAVSEAARDATFEAPPSTASAARDIDAFRRRLELLVSR
jgi:hypothetical protein